MSSRSRRPSSRRKPDDVWGWGIVALIVFSAIAAVFALGWTLRADFVQPRRLLEDRVLWAGVRRKNGEPLTWN